MIWLSSPAAARSMSRRQRREEPCRPPRSACRRLRAVKQPAVEEVVGTVQPKLQAVIEAKVSGRITRLPVTLGQSVKQGDVLVELATQEIQARLDQANAAFRQAELDFNRTVESAQANTPPRRPNWTPRRRATTSPKPPWPRRRRCPATRRSSPRSTAWWPASSRTRATWRCPASRCSNWKAAPACAWWPMSRACSPAMCCRTRNSPCGWTPLPDPITGTVAEISPAADPASRTVRMKVDLPETAGLRSGQFGRLAVPVGEATFLFVPPPALVRRGQLEILFVAADGKAQMRLVRAGKQTAQGIEILAGLAPGEAVVVEGAGTLRDGQPLQTQ